MTARRFSPALLLMLALSAVPWTAMAQQTSINWMSLEEAVAAQQDEPRKIMMDVYTQWCGPCKMMMRNTFTNADVISYVNANYYAVKFDAESPNPVVYQDRTFKNPRWDPNARGRNSTHELSRALGVNAYPTLMYFDENGAPIAPIPGYKSPQQLEKFLRFFAEAHTPGPLQEQWENYQDTFSPSFQ